MDMGAWVGLVGVVLVNGGALVAVVVRRARRDQMIEDKLAEIDRDMKRRHLRLDKLDATCEDLRRDTGEIKINVARMMVLIEGWMRRNGNKGGA